MRYKLTPSMHKTLSEIVGFDLPGEATKEEFLESISEFAPDKHDLFVMLFGVMEKEQPVMDVIYKYKKALEGDVAIIPQEFAKKFEKELNKSRIKNKTKDSVDGGMTYKQKKNLIKVRKKYDRLILTKSHTRAKNILMKDEGWTLQTLEKNLTKGKKLLQK